MSFALIALLATLASLGGVAISDSVKKKKGQRPGNPVSNFKEDFPDIAKGMTDSEIKAFLNDNYGEGNRWFSSDPYSYNINEAKEDYNQMSRLMGNIGPMPDMVNYDDIARQAEQAIKNEDAGLMQMFERDAQEQLADSNQAYGQMQRQVLSNDYQKNAQLMGTVGSQMSKARQSALEAGASAGARLAGNINTLLSVQNRQSQQSLDTSNNLAQMMLNQRQAAMGIKSNLSNQRANVMGGQLNRISGYQSNRLGMEESLYDARMKNWEDQFSAAAGTNPFQDYYRRQQQQNRNGY